MHRPKSLTLLALEARIRALVDQEFQKLRQSRTAADPKAAVRGAHERQRNERLASEQLFLERAWHDLACHFADGVDLSPEAIRPRLELVVAGTWQARLFRLATLTWSVPVSRGYGRRMRFLVWDDHNAKLIGVIGLTDPVFNLGARDAYIGWSLRQRRRSLVNVMDAYVLGAIPPYNMLLGGKLIACLLRTKEVRDTFSMRYRDRSGKISKRKKYPRLVMITTTSALGRSSVYNRLRIDGSQFLRAVGYTAGYGHFHISDEIVALMRKYLTRRRHSYANGHQYGDGPNWRMRLIRESLVKLGYSPSLLNHGLRREVFVCELAVNALSVLKGSAALPRYTDLSDLDVVARSAINRWIVPRARRDERYRLWKKEELLPSLQPYGGAHSGEVDVAAG